MFPTVRRDSLLPGWYKQRRMPGWSRAILKFLAFSALFLLISSFAGWAENAGHGSPGGYGLAGGTHPNDSRLKLVLLEHSFQNIGVSVSDWLDLPIFFPAQKQLLGSEHLLSGQLLYAPIRLLVESPLFAANLALLLSYILAAFFMEKLLSDLGFEEGIALGGGAIFALGPLWSMPHLQLFQYQAFLLPWLALCLHRLREDPRAARAGVVGAVLLVGSLSSLYSAAILAFLGTTWTLLEFARPRVYRFRFLCLATAPALVAGGLSLLVQQEWFLNRSAPGMDPVETALAGMRIAEGRGSALWALLPNLIPVLFGWPLLFGAILGSGQVVSSDSELRFASRAGLVLMMVGFFLVPGMRVAGYPMPSILDGLQAFFPGLLRVPERCLLLSGFGMVILLAAALASLARFLSTRICPRLANCLIAALGLLVLGDRIQTTLETPFDTYAPLSEEAKIYEEVARIVAKKPGPLLELPYRSVTWSNAPDSMVGQLTHGMPLLTGHSGYFPPHHDQLLELLAMAPEPAALRALIRLSGMRWLLLRSDARLPNQQNFFQQKLPPEWVQTNKDIYGWRLLEIEIPDLQASWLAYVSGPPRAGFSPLGTPLVDLKGAPVQLAGKSRFAQWFTDAKLPVEIELTNPGDRGWGARSLPGESDHLAVRFLVTWGNLASGKLEQFEQPLLHDIGPGESANFSLRIPTPTKPGDYSLHVRLVQGGHQSLGLPVLIASRIPLVNIEVLNSK